MKIAIIGAGFAGLSTAKVLQRVGHDVTVYEKAPDVGGVWSGTRRYPGLSTQNNKGTYALSDYPMPKSYPEWPSGQQVQEYLEGYVQKFALAPYLRLRTEVVSAELADDGTGWLLSTRQADGDAKTDGAATTDTFDYLVVANGIFCEPFIPPFTGVEEFAAAGGRLCAVSDFHELEDARGKHVVVVGYGKSSCDIAAALSGVAADVNVVARELLWKMPKKLGGVLNYKYLMLTRMGEGLFRYLEPRGFERFLHGAGNGLRGQMLGSVQALATRQLALRKLALVPQGTFEDIARSTVSLATDDFYPKVVDGSIAVHRDCVVVRLLEKDGRPHAELASGRVLPADLVLCGTGFQQVVPFFNADLQDRLTDERGNFALYRQIQPLDVPRLSFAGYNSSFFSPLSAEMAAVWIANNLIGGVELPPIAQRRRAIADRIQWMEERTDGHHARGTNIIPFSVHNIDEVLNEIGLNVGPLTRLRQWLGPVNPSAYQRAMKGLLKRHEASEFSSSLAR